MSAFTINHHQQRLNHAVNELYRLLETPSPHHCPPSHHPTASHLDARLTQTATGYIISAIQSTNAAKQRKAGSRPEMTQSCAAHHQLPCCSWSLPPYFSAGVASGAATGAAGVGAGATGFSSLASGLKGSSFNGPLVALIPAAG